MGGRPPHRPARCVLKTIAPGEATSRVMARTPSAPTSSTHPPVRHRSQRNAWRRRRTCCSRRSTGPTAFCRSRTLRGARTVRRARLRLHPRGPVAAEARVSGWGSGDGWHAGAARMVDRWQNIRLFFADREAAAPSTKRFRLHSGRSARRTSSLFSSAWLANASPLPALSRRRALEARL